VFQFVDHRDRIILNRDVALGRCIEPELIASLAEFTVYGPAASLPKNPIEPFELRLLSQQLQYINRW
jgi:hypothetical protein